MPTKLLQTLNVINQYTLDDFCRLSLREKHMVLQCCAIGGRKQFESNLSYFTRSLKEIISMNLINSFVDEVSIEITERATL